MRYEPRNIILGILALGLLFAAPVYAGTGPSTDSSDEVTYSTVIVGTSTSKITIFPAPSSTTDWYSLLPSGHTAGGVFYIINGTVSYNPFSPCYYTDTSNFLLSGSGGYFDSSTFEVSQTSGTISIGYYPYHDEFNTNLSSTPIGILGSCPNSISSSSNWTSAYWDIDTLDLSGGESSTQQYFDWYTPVNYTSGTITAPKQFVTVDENYRRAGYEYRIFFEIYGVNTSTLKYSYGSTWSETDFPDEEQFLIVNVPYDLYVPSSSTPYNILARLQERETGSFMPTVLDEEWVYFVVDQSADTSTIFAKPKPFPTSSTERANVYQDCGNWYEFHLGCHLENFAVYLFYPDFAVPNGGTVNPLVTVWTAYFDVFPFSVFSAYKENFEQQISNTSSSNDINFELTIASHTLSVPIAGRDFMVDRFGETNTNTYYNWFIGALATALVLAMVNGIIKLFF